MVLFLKTGRFFFCKTCSLHFSSCLCVMQHLPLGCYNEGTMANLVTGTQELVHPHVPGEHQNNIIDSRKGLFLQNLLSPLQFLPLCLRPMYNKPELEGIPTSNKVQDRSAGCPNLKKIKRSVERSKAVIEIKALHIITKFFSNLTMHSLRRVPRSDKLLSQEPELLVLCPSPQG